MRAWLRSAALLLCAAGAFGAPLTEIQRAWISKAGKHEKKGWIYLHVRRSAVFTDSTRREFRSSSVCAGRLDAGMFLAAHPQFDWLEGALKSRESQPWVQFRAGESE